MINTKRLIDLFDPPVYIGDVERVHARAPLTADELPAESTEKLGLYDFPPWFIMEVEDIHLWGPALVGIKDDEVVLDVGYYGRLDLWERNAPYYRMALAAIDQPAVEIDTAISLCSCWSGNDAPPAFLATSYRQRPTASTACGARSRCGLAGTTC